MRQTGRLHTIACGEGELTYELTRKQVKNVNLRVRADGCVCVSASPRVPLASIDAFVGSKADFIVRAREKIALAQSRAPQPPRYENGARFPFLGQTLTLWIIEAREESLSREGGLLRLLVRDAGDASRVQALVERYFADLTGRVFGEALARYCPLLAAYDVRMPALRIRAMKTRWGTCLPQKGIVTLNARLVGYPLACIEYVAAHELCHLVHPDHSARFYALLSSLLPDWKRRKALLRRPAGNLEEENSVLSVSSPREEPP